MIKQRESNLELLRMVCMYFVVLHHFFVHGIQGIMGFQGFSEQSNDLLITFINGFIFFCLNCFLLISGYFGISFKVKGLLNIYIQCFFYGLVFYLLHLYISDQPIGWVVLRKSFFVISHSPWWYVTSYIYLYLMAPLLNKAIKHLTKKEYIYVLFIFTILNLYFGYFWGGAFNPNGRGIMNFIYLYLIGRYLKIHVDFSKFSTVSIRQKSLLVYLVSSILLGVMALVVHKSGIELLESRVWALNNPLLILYSVAILIFFSTLKFQSITINWLAKSCLAVYLIHEYGYVNQYIYPVVTRSYYYMMSSFGNITGVFTLVFLAFVLFMACLLIDKVRIAFTAPVEKVMMKIWFLIKGKFSGLFYRIVED